MTLEGAHLQQFVPEPPGNIPIEFNQSLQPVVDRIAKRLPKDLIWQLYATSPSETGGHVVFPRCRVDGCVIDARDKVYAINHLTLDQREKTERYEKASKKAFKALVWVEIGFQGLENLAKSPASKNWTSTVGHFVSDKQREKEIMTSGKAMYEEMLTAFATFRHNNGITGDIFTQYDLEYLLTPFLSPPPRVRS